MNRTAPPASLLIAVMIACVSTCYGFGMSLFPQIIPDMRRDLVFDYGFVGTVTGLVQLSTVGFAVLATWLVHRIGAARTVVSSVLLCGLCLSVIPFTDNIYVVAGLLMLAGGTGASTFVPMIELASRVVSAEQRGFAMSLISSAPAYGVLINSALVAAFAGNGHWQMAWHMTGAATLVLAAATGFLFHRAGFFEAAVSDGTAAPAAEGAVGLRSIMPWVLLIFALGFLNGTMPYPYLTYLSPYLREELGYSVGFASGLWATIGAVGIGAGFIIGLVSSRLAPGDANLLHRVSRRGHPDGARSLAGTGGRVGHPVRARLLPDLRSVAGLCLTPRPAGDRGDRARHLHGAAGCRWHDGQHVRRGDQDVDAELCRPLSRRRHCRRDRGYRYAGAEGRRQAVALRIWLTTSAFGGPPDSPGS